MILSHALFMYDVGMQDPSPNTNKGWLGERVGACAIMLLNARTGHNGCPGLAGAATDVAVGPCWVFDHFIAMINASGLMTTSLLVRCLVGSKPFLFLGAKFDWRTNVINIRIYAHDSVGPSCSVAAAATIL